MKISIITVVYNNRQTIEDCILSVINQDIFEKVEYIIVDGGSTDGTLEILDKYKPFLSNLISEPDLGIYDAMNKGISASTGNIVGFLNSDDLYYNSEILKIILQKFEEIPYLDILYGDLVYVSRNDINNFVRMWHSKSYFNSFFENGNVPPHPSLFLQRNVYESAGKFNLNYRLAADYEFMLRIFKKFNFKSMYLPTILVKMRLGGATNKNWKNIYRGNVEILRAWHDNGINPPLFLMPKRILKRVKQFFK
jgi:glycosyltransferase